MAKKHKKRFRKIASSSPALNPNPSFSPQPEQFQSQESTPTVGTTSVHSSMNTMRELRSISLTFLLLMLILGTIVSLNSRTSYLNQWSNQLSQYLHID